MAKVTITFEDTWKDGQPILKGRFQVDPEKTDEPGIIPTAEIVGQCIKRLWDGHVLFGHAALVCRDLIVRNRMVREARDGNVEVPPQPPAALLPQEGVPAPLLADTPPPLEQDLAQSPSAPPPPAEPDASPSSESPSTPA